MTAAPMPTSATPPASTPTYVDQLIATLTTQNQRYADLERELVATVNAELQERALWWAETKAMGYTTLKEREREVDARVLHHTLDLTTINSELRISRSTIEATLAILKVVAR